MRPRRPTTKQAEGALGFDLFRGALDMFEQMMGWIQSEAGRKSHSEMERALRKCGFELMRVMYQAWLDRCLRQERRQAALTVRHPGVSVRSRGRGIDCDFGSDRLSRLGYTRPGQDTAKPRSLPNEPLKPRRPSASKTRSQTTMYSQPLRWRLPRVTARE